MYSRSLVAISRRILRDAGVRSLLSEPNANPKLAKSLGVNAYTAPMHLAPANLSGFEVCPKATAGCRAACLHTAGNPIYMAGKSRARIARTRAYFTKREAFLIVLWAEIAAHRRRALALGMIPAVRLNATSDIPWERVRLPGLQNNATTLMDAFPDVTFYDYTKRANRDLPANYSVTFSLAEDNDDAARIVLARGGNVAAVFNVRRGQPLPQRWAGYAVIDGDEHDFRPIDPRGVVVGLRAKGSAIGDASGFVRRV